MPPAFQWDSFWTYFRLLTWKVLSLSGSSIFLLGNICYSKTDSQLRVWVWICKACTLLYVICYYFNQDIVLMIFRVCHISHFLKILCSRGVFWIILMMWTYCEFFRILKWFLLFPHEGQSLILKYPCPSIGNQ